MVGEYLSLIIEYARAKTAAVIPDPHENTTLFSSNIPTSLNFFFIKCLFLKVLSFLLIRSANGRQYEFLIDPLLRPVLGSFSRPKNLFLLLASTTLNFLSKIFLSISFLVLTK